MNDDLSLCRAVFKINYRKIAEASGVPNSSPPEDWLDREWNSTTGEFWRSAWTFTKAEETEKVRGLIEALEKIIEYGNTAYGKGTADSHSFNLGKIIGVASGILAKYNDAK